MVIGGRAVPAYTPDVPPQVRGLVAPLLGAAEAQCGRVVAVVAAVIGAAAMFAVPGSGA